jgi:hypothetical protein
MVDTQAFTERVLTWSVVLLGLLALAAVVVALLRRLNVGESMESDAPPFSLHDLRKLHREGKLTDEEFQRARSAMIAMIPGASVPADQAEADDPARSGDDSDPGIHDQPLDSASDGQNTDDTDAPDDTDDPDDPGDSKSWPPPPEDPPSLPPR